MAIDSTKESVDGFYLKNGPCCAGCDFWQYHNSVIGDCLRSPPVSGLDRVSMLGIESLSIEPDSGHIMTARHHLCGDFKDYKHTKEI